MTKPFLPLAAVCALFLSAAASGVAAPSDYQVTGPITALDATTITVTKGKENFEIAKVASVDMSDLKVGDKVTVHYTMAVKSIEKKDAAPKKEAKAAGKKDAAASPAPSAAPKP